MKEQGKGREILFAASLRNGLAGAISETVTTASLACTLRLGNGCYGLLYTSRGCHQHLILISKRVLVERSTEGGEMERNETIHPIRR